MGLKVDKRRVGVLMADRGIDTKKSLAERAELDQETVREALNGRAFSSLTVERLAKALGCNEMDLLATEGSPAPLLVAPSFAVAGERT
jgi:hypothetical protein